VAREHKIPVHMDGARLFNASIASGVPPCRIVRDISTVNICLSKSLGAPVGSVLAGDSKFIAR
jgi:threonine aldolase